MDKKESFYWDIVKGTAIFLMLWGHCVQFCSLYVIDYFEDIVFKVIYTFHMPVFMIVSGYLFSYSFRKRSLPDLLEHRLRGMLHPIIMATILNNILMQILIYFLTDRVDFLFGRLFEGIKDDLWFLWAVFYSSLLVGVCGKVTEKPALQILLAILAAVVILIFPQWNMTLFMYPYFVAGFFSGLYRDAAGKLYQILKYVAIVAFPILVAFYERKHFIYLTPMFSEELGLAASAEIALFRWLIGFVGSIWMLFIMEGLQRLGDRIPAVQSGLQRVALLGRNSLQIYCLSASLLTGYLPQLYRKFIKLAGGNLFADNKPLFHLLFTPLLAAAWAVFLYEVVVVLKKCKVHRLIFGR